MTDSSSDNGDGSSSSSSMHTTAGISAFFVLFSTLLAAVLILSKLLLHDRPRLAAILPESGMILLVGGMAGFLVNIFVSGVNDNYYNDDDNDSVAHSLLSFSPEVFFIALLPPIIFNVSLFEACFMSLYSSTSKYFLICITYIYFLVIYLIIIYNMI